jgi:hypothetical protein
MREAAKIALKAGLIVRYKMGDVWHEVSPRSLSELYTIGGLKKAITTLEHNEMLARERIKAIREKIRTCRTLMGFVRKSLKHR